MNVVLWIVAGVLAAAYLGAGFLKLTTAKDALVEKGMAWAADFGPKHIKLIGAAELVGAVGLILPWALDVAPKLTPIAATCLALLMIGAAATHVKRGDAPKDAVPSAVLALLSIFVAAGRF
jgi:hypothetical protein